MERCLVVVLLVARSGLDAGPVPSPLDGHSAPKYDPGEGPPECPAFSKCVHRSWCMSERFITYKYSSSEEPTDDSQNINPYVNFSQDDTHQHEEFICGRDDKASVCCADAAVREPPHRSASNPESPQTFDIPDGSQRLLQHQSPSLSDSVFPQQPPYGNLDAVATDGLRHEPVELDLSAQLPSGGPVNAPSFVDVPLGEGPFQDINNDEEIGFNHINENPSIALPESQFLDQRNHLINTNKVLQVNSGQFIADQSANQLPNSDLRFYDRQPNSFFQQSAHSLPPPLHPDRQMFFNPDKRLFSGIAAQPSDQRITLNNYPFQTSQNELNPNLSGIQSNIKNLQVIETENVRKHFQPASNLLNSPSRGFSEGNAPISNFGNFPHQSSADVNRGFQVTADLPEGLPDQVFPQSDSSAQTFANTGPIRTNRVGGLSSTDFTNGPFRQPINSQGVYSQQNDRGPFSQSGQLYSEQQQQNLAKTLIRGGIVLSGSGWRRPTKPDAPFGQRGTQSKIVTGYGQSIRPGPQSPQYEKKHQHIVPYTPTQLEIIGIPQRPPYGSYLPYSQQHSRYSLFGPGPSAYLPASYRPFGPYSGYRGEYFNSVLRYHGPCGLRPDFSRLKDTSHVRGPLPHGRISSGYDSDTGVAGYGQYPWHAALLVSKHKYRETFVPDYDGWKHVCGGTLVHEQFVLTAAHCVHGMKPHELLVRLGDWDLHSDYGEQFPPVDSRVTEFHVHPGYLPNVYRHDLALLQLAQPVRLDLTPHIGTACLPYDKPDISKLRCSVAGWGHDPYEPKKNKHLLKAVGMVKMSNDVCQSGLRETVLGPRFSLQKGQFCAAGKRGEDTCLGDGGSGVVCEVVSDDGYGHRAADSVSKKTKCHGHSCSKWVLAGVTSFGLSCGEEDLPGIYTNVADYLDWIQNVLFYPYLKRPYLYRGY